MSHPTNPYVGDVGTEIRLDTKVDISGHTPSIKVKKPDGTTVTWTGVDTTTVVPHPDTGVNSIVQHVTQAGDLDQHGVWKLMAYVSGTFTGHGKTTQMTVKSLFDE